MKHFIILTIVISALLLACNVQKTEDANRYSKVCFDMLKYIRQNDVSNATSLMDSIFLVMAKRDSFDIARNFNAISEKLNSDYRGEIKYKVATEENTFHENLPSKFLIVKLETTETFGYYYFYINKQSGKILLLGLLDLKFKRG